MKVSENISLRELNSFGVEAHGARLVEWETPDELQGISFEGRWLALGGGNNMLFTKDFDGTLIKSAARNITVTGETSETLSARAEAGMDWNDLIAWSISRKLWGAENLSGIPGTVGAAPIQNIGAYGAEVKDIISSVECFCIGTGAFLTLAAEHCGFGYRDSVFKRTLRGRVIVTAVNFTLSKTPQPNLRYAELAESERRHRIKEGASGSEEFASATPESISRTVTEIRNSKLPDPRITGNAGSFFKNPVIDTLLAQEIAACHPDMPLYPADSETRTKLSAGWLIEKAGWRGRVEGRVGIHPRQALIIINRGGATGREIVDFARRVQADVHKKFGVELETEVNIIC